MDIHRCRFVPYSPSAINALAFSHSSSLSTPGKGPQNLRLAVGRANGDIEIWNPLKGSWYQESILRGGKNRSIEGLSWIQDPEDIDKNGYKIPGKLRLFSIGYSTTVTEWDLGLGRPIRHSAGNFGEIWCMATQPLGQAKKKIVSQGKEDTLQDSEPQVQNIAVGCADGAIVLLTTAEGDLGFDRILARPSKKRARSLSITFQNRNTIIVGHADSTIRIYGIQNGQQTRSMTLGAGPKGGPSEILVWTVKCLNDGTIVSGDSTGTVSFWDGKTYSLLQRIKSHEADILDLAVSSDGQSAFSGGMDRRTTLYRRAAVGRGGGKLQWAKITHQRLHNHDVKAMATFETKHLSILASGGLDTTPIIVPIQEFGKEYHRTLSSLPQQPNIRSALRKRLIMSWWDREISIWAMSRSQGDATKRSISPKSSEKPGRKLVAKISIQGDESISSADLSSNGSMVVVSTMAEVKVFSLRTKATKIRVRKLALPAEISRKGARSLHLSPDNKWLAIVRPENELQLYRIVSDGIYQKESRFLRTAVELKRLFREPTATKHQHGCLGSYNRLITHATFSADSSILAVGDISGYLDTWVLEGHEDLTQKDDGETNNAKPSMSSDDTDGDEEYHPNVILGQHWMRNPSASLLIKLPAAPLILSFRPLIAQSTQRLTNGNSTIHSTRHTPHPHSHDLPQGEDRLFILTAENQMYEFNVLSGRISDWTRRNPTSMLPKEFRDQRERVKGCLWNVDPRNERIWLYGVSWLWMFDLSKDLPSPESPSSEDLDAKNSAAAGKTLKRIRKHNAPDRESVSRLRHDTGAGSQVPKSELGIGIGRKIRKTDGSGRDEDRLNRLEMDYSATSEGVEDYVLASDLALVKSRRGPQEIGHAEGGNSESNTNIDGETSPNEDTRMVRRPDNERPAYWHTYKYRPILGIVPLGHEHEEESEGSYQDGDDDCLAGGVEVALVERPLWDVSLPPQYEGNKEWNHRI